ncbi:MAG: LysM peptidoglycan-binding domain-containing M23 family metallopeptidase [Leptospiraceae bacterium]|nr:LysM peptidoglycan-binding domain-containing M23 family metallopeptidase [Leptospiraceae bacterium]
MRQIVFLLLFCYLSFSIYPESIDQIESEIREYTEKDSSSFFDSDESKIKELFLSEELKNDGIDDNSEHSKYGYNKLPDTIRVSRILSSKVVRNTRSSVAKYRVGENETLDTVAKKHKVAGSKIKKINRLKSSKLAKGQVLKIPVIAKGGPYYKITKVKVFTLPVVNARISSRYGSRKDPFNHFKRNYHTGLDLSAEVGTAVIASADGIVEFTGRNGGYGNTVVIRHKDGYRTAYAHCADMFVKVGDSVKMGKVIAMVGRTGTATGAHLHFEVTLNGRYMNPEKALKKVEIYTSKAINSVAKL